MQNSALALCFGVTSAFLAVPAQANPLPLPCPQPLWSSTVHSQGSAWQYNPDPALMVVLVDDNQTWGRGLHVVYRGVDRSFTPLLVIPPASGPIAVQTCAALVLRVAGSGENGCSELGYDDVLATVQVSSTAATHAVTIRADGTVYWSFPGTGSLSVQELPASGPPIITTVQVAPLVSSSGQLVFAAADILTHSGTSAGTVILDILTVLPWLQLEGHGSVWPFLEVDMDHSCEAQYAPLARPSTAMTLFVPRCRYIETSEQASALCVALPDPRDGSTSE